jgi:DNA-binding response OmpR family regulator
MLKLLVVEPDADVSAVLKEGVEDSCAAVVTCAASGRVAAEVLCSRDVELALIAAVLPDLSGFDLARAAADCNVLCF